MTLPSAATLRLHRLSMVTALLAGALTGCDPAEMAPSPGAEETSQRGDEPAAQVSAPSTAVNRQVLEFHNSATRDGLYVDGAFTRAAAATLKRDARFSARVNGPTYAQPLYFEGGPGGKDLLIVATEQNEVTAFDALDGAVVWRKTLAPPAQRRPHLPCGNIATLGVTGTPVIDPASRTLVVAAMTLSGSTPQHKIFALSLDDGSTKAGWPVNVDSVRAGTFPFESRVQNQRGALTILNNTVYVPYGGHYGDCGNYKGWVVGVPLDNPRAPIAWATRAKGGGLWSPGGVASDGSSLYVVTGNTMAPNRGLFSAPSTWGDGEAVFKLPPSLRFSGQDADFAAAMNWQALDRADQDVGGSGPILFNVFGATPSTLGMALGKDGFSYLLNSKNLGGMGRFLSAQRVASEMIITAPAAYGTKSGTFVAFKGNGLGCTSAQRKITALKVSAGSPPKVSVAWCAGPQGQGSPIVTTTGANADPIVWYVAAEADNKLRGFDGETGEVIFNGGGAREQMSGITRFTSPIVAKGRMFVAGNSEVYAFTVDGAPAPTTTTPAPTAQPAGNAAACTQGYQTFGERFMTTYCTSCHGAAVQTAGLRLDSGEAVTASAYQILAAAASESGVNVMPPAGARAPTDAERQQLRTWLNDCK